MHNQENDTSTCRQENGGAPIMWVENQRSPPTPVDIPFLCLNPFGRFIPVTERVRDSSVMTNEINEATFVD